VVALKMLLSGEFASRAELARFRREAEAIAALQHPNIVQVYDVGDVDGRPYFTMEFVAGGTLAQKLSGVPQPAQTSASLTQTLARAIHAAHVAGIVHRDLKPGNILLTSDGVPKISDFGLARHLEGPPTDVTLGPTKVGTPSYMAPEQVVGKPDSVGPPADVYALGATLYELLTGRPPFRGETATETQRQVTDQEPAAPSRLNAKVPRDLETICLKCLRKEPARRYATAEALADDVRRFEEGRPIHARPVGWTERAWRWSKRNPMAAALLLTALALVSVASGGGTWFVQQRSRHNAELHRDVDAALAQAVTFRKGFHFSEARELLEGARERLEPSGSDDLRRRIAEAQALLTLVERLDGARFRGLTFTPTEFDRSSAEPLYIAAFAQFGHGDEDPSVVAARVRDSEVSAEIVDALDDWASLTKDPVCRKWLFAIARQVDPDPERNRLRQPNLWDTPGGVAQPIPQLNADKLSPRIATALARLMQSRGMKGTTPLTAVQARVPQDFWLNIELGTALFVAQRPEEALVYVKSALALRPDSAPAHNAVGGVLHAMGRVDEAIDEYHKALAIDPKYAYTHGNLGEALRSQGNLDEAIGHFREAIAVNPKLSNAYICLAAALGSQNLQDEAVRVLKDAVRLGTPSPVAHNNLAIAVGLKGDMDEAIAQLQEAIKINPEYAIGQMNLGEALWATGRLEEAIEHIQQAERLDPPDAEAQAFLCQHLYAAACRAVGQALGQQAGKPQVDETDRANLRLRALDWLRASLSLAIKLVDNGRGQPSSLLTWQHDPRLGSVRDPAGLAKLPPAERDQWLWFWNVVAAEIVTDPVTMARERVFYRDWVAAARAYTLAVSRGPMNDGDVWFEIAAVRVLSDDRQGYAAACRELFERCGKPVGPRAYHVARAGTLAAGGGDQETSRLGQLAHDELQQHAAESWSLTEQGALAYRAGRFEQAVALFEKSLQANSKPGAAVVNWVWLSLANQRLGKTDEARRWLNKAQTWLDQYRNGLPPRAQQELGLHLHNWLEANVLRREAEAMISPPASTAPTH
jgi:serine/threonine-protein kinase